MKYSILLLTFLSFSALAMPFTSTKEQLRLELWYEGIAQSKDKISKVQEETRPAKKLPIELEMALIKM